MDENLQPGAALEFVSGDRAMQLLQKAEPFRELMMYYDCALQEVRTKFEVLDREF